MWMNYESLDQFGYVLDDGEKWTRNFYFEIH